MGEVLTIIIPTFNRAESLKKCLDSLIKQTDRDFEVLLIDGGSTEMTDKIIERFSIVYWGRGLNWALQQPKSMTFFEAGSCLDAH